MNIFFQQFSKNEIPTTKNQKLIQNKKRNGTASTGSLGIPEQVHTPNSINGTHGKRQIFQKQFPTYKMMTTSTHHKSSEQQRNSQNYLKTIDNNNNNSRTKIDNTGVQTLGATSSRQDQHILNKKIRSTPRVSINFPKNLSQATSPARAEQNILKTMIYSGQGGQPSMAAQKSRQSLENVSKPNFQNNDCSVQFSSANKTGHFLSSAMPKTSRTAITFEPQQQQQISQQNTDSYHRDTQGTLGQTLPRFGGITDVNNPISGILQMDDACHLKSTQMGTAPKEITQMKVANPLNPTKFKTLFKKSRPSMQLDAQQQKKELIQETIANNSSSEGRPDFEFLNDNDTDNQMQLSHRSKNNNIDSQRSKNSGQHSASRQIHSQLQLFSNSKSMRNNARNQKHKGYQVQLNRTEMNQLNQKMVSPKSHARPNMTMSNKSKPEGASINDNNQVILARIPDNSLAQNHQKAPGGRLIADLKDYNEGKLAASYLASDKTLVQNQLQQYASKSSDEERSQSPFDTYRQNLQKKYQNYAATKNYKHTDLDTNQNSKMSDFGQNLRMTSGAPRSLSNLQKLEFKANRDDDSPKVLGEESDFSDD